MANTATASRHLPEHLGVVACVGEAAVVTHQHLADEEHDLGEEAEGEEDAGHGADLGRHVVDALERAGEDEREHPVAPVGTHQVGGE